MYACIYVCIYLYIRISLERSILIVAEQFLLELIKKYGKYPVSTYDDDDDGTWYLSTSMYIFEITSSPHSLTHSITHIIMKKVSL